ncbi:MAG: HU family DNA-binding protein [Prevotella sp.]
MGKLAGIADVLVQRHGLRPEEAESFVALMFKVIDESLHKERLVKVKGLGTFKVTTVSARESVDVNTGERIVIEGRDKITFTPDATLRDRVNSPFAQFETVILNEGVDFSEIDNRMNIATPVEQEVPVAEPEHVDIRKKEAKVELPEKEPEATEQKEVKETVMEVASVCHEQEVEETETEEQTEDAEEEEDRPHGKLWLYVAIVLLCANLASFFYFHTELQKKEAEITALDTANATLLGRLERLSAPRVKPEAKDSCKMTVDMKKDSVSGKGQDAAPMAIQEETEKAEEDKYNDDPRVRTGAYRITGVAATAKIQSGQTFASVCKAYLGPGMECYVEALNGKSDFKVGDSVKIPRLELKRKAPRH